MSNLTIGILGGSGRVGRAVAEELRGRGHRVIVVSRSAAAGFEHRRADVTTGIGLAFAMLGLDVLVETLNGPAEVHDAGTERALAAARSSRVGHVVSLSAAGTGRAPTEYHRLKAGQEAIVRDCGVPFSIVRAAPLHTGLESMFTACALTGFLPLMPVPLQPVDRGELAAHLADVVEGGPSGTAAAFVGPREERLDRLAMLWAAARDARVRPLRLSAARELRDGALLHPEAWTGRATFADWLSGRAAPALEAVAA
jgi:uncharacterized protein YbjT (DUF2867 family)